MKWLMGCLLILTILWVPNGAMADSFLESANYEFSIEPADAEAPWDDSGNSQNQGFFEDDIVHPLYYSFLDRQKQQLTAFHFFLYSEPFLAKQVRPPRA